MVATMRMMFKATKTVCSFPMILERVDARTPWSNTQHRKTAYTTPLLGVQFPSRAMTILEISEEEDFRGCGGGSH